MPWPPSRRGAKFSPAALLAGLAGIASLACSPDACAATAGASATGTASAQIVEPISLTELDELDFGIAKGASNSGGSVTVGADGTPARYSGGAGNACSAAAACPPPHAAHFRVSGAQGRTYVITLPGTVVISGVRDLSGTPVEGLVVTNLTSRTGNLGLAGPVGKLDATGKDTFAVGGTLDLPAGVPPGHYHTTIDVLVAYN